LPDFSCTTNQNWEKCTKWPYIIPISISMSNWPNSHKIYKKTLQGPPNLNQNRNIWFENIWQPCPQLHWHRWGCRRKQRSDCWLGGLGPGWSDAFVKKSPKL
jgi:hypothetical protein